MENKYKNTYKLKNSKFHLVRLRADKHFYRDNKMIAYHEFDCGQLVTFDGRKDPKWAKEIYSAYLGHSELEFTVDPISENDFHVFERYLESINLNDDGGIV